ncbi:hypothetical protein HPP92_013766 [Vanilla planifolia]|uniref:Uncharacterized protein n=1 Tax=Vanilla planifolia TaxID=51239 RepID=A0A835QVD1_VANPL|nr:hypothetical protein HPP92_013766 [Vanilla planifolia]
MWVSLNAVLHRKAIVGAATEIDEYILPKFDTCASRSTRVLPASAFYFSHRSRNLQIQDGLKEVVIYIPFYEIPGINKPVFSSAACSEIRGLCAKRIPESPDSYQFRCFED